MQPGTARIGDTATITGVNLLPPAAEEAKPTVSVGDVNAQEVTPPGPADTIAFTVPAPATAWPPQTAQQVAVTTTAGAIAVLNGALTIVADQALITHVTPPRFKVGDQARVLGAFLLAPGTAYSAADTATASVGGLTGVISADTGPGPITWPVQFIGNYSDSSVGLTIEAPSLNGQPTPEADTPATLTLSRAGGKQASASVTIAPTPITPTPAPVTTEPS